MVHTVGLIGANGRVGGATARNLLPYAQDGKIKLVLFYREQSPLKDFSSSDNVELRPIDLSSSVDELASAVKGVNVFISALAAEALPNEPKLVDALAKAGDLITFVPSSYSAPWSAEDEADQAFGPMLKFMHGGWNHAKELGLGVTPFYIGGFEDYIFEYGFLGFPIKGNMIWANEKQLKHKLPVTLSAHLGEAIAKVVVQDPQQIKNENYSAVTYFPTGQDLVDLYTKLNGQPAQIKNYTPADTDAYRADMANMGPLKAAYFEHWENGNWGYGDGKTEVESSSAPTLEETAKRFI